MSTLLEKMAAKWTLGKEGEKATPEYAIYMAYNVCRAVDKALQTCPVYVYRNWSSLISHSEDLLTYAYHQAKQYKAKGEIPTPKEYSKALSRLLMLKDRGLQEPAVSRKVDSLFTDAGYGKSRTAEDWSYLIDKHLYMVRMC